MNSKKTIFLGGPIQYATSSDGKFDIKIKRLIEIIIKSLNDYGYNVLSAHVAEGFGTHTFRLTDGSICNRDFTWMCESDLYIALILSNDECNLIRSDGTYVEIGWASMQKKPIILIMDSNQFSELSKVVKGLSMITNVYILDLNKIDENCSMLMSIVNKIFRNRICIQTENNESGICNES